MDKFKKPEGYPVHKGDFITLPTPAWNEVCNCINRLIDYVNAQSESIEALSKQVSENSKAIQECNSDIVKIASIMEDIYENIE